MLNNKVETLILKFHPKKDLSPELALAYFDKYSVCVAIHENEPPIKLICLENLIAFILLYNIISRKESTYTINQVNQ